MKKGLQINDYANDINLFDEFSFVSKHNSEKEQVLDELLLELKEQSSLNLSYVEKRRLLHAKQNTLHPNTLGEDAIEKLNCLLQLELQEKIITDAETLFNESKTCVGKSKITVWQGDITSLKTDAIVNAANNQMLGCWQPLHACIDNAIHTAAGIQLRDDCDVIMQKQGFAEPTGTAKITRAYNLPSKFVLHTVGPIVQGAVSEQSKMELASAYNSCMDICKEIKAIRSIAFCCISTGVFGYPAEQAAIVALNTVKIWLKNNPGSLDLVVFNVFGDKDKMIYEPLIDEL